MENEHKINPEEEESCEHIEEQHVVDEQLQDAAGGAKSRPPARALPCMRL